MNNLSINHRDLLMRAAIFLATLAATTLAPYAQGEQRELAIWPGKAPGSETSFQKEIHYTVSSPNPADPQRTDWKMVRNVADPTITIYQPETSKANGTGIVICPGGGFRFLSWESEGTEVAQWLAAHGVTAFVLKYRLIKTPLDPKEFDKGPGNSKSEADEKLAVFFMAAADGLQALKVVRQHAAEWGVSPDRIGIMGFSAGADITMAASLDYDASNRPTFAVLIYGGIQRGVPPPADAPPLFILAAQDDPYGFGTTDSEIAYNWQGTKHSAELHLYAKGGHGFGMKKQGLPIDHWIERFGEWLDSQGLLTRKSDSRRP